MKRLVLFVFAAVTLLLVVTSSRATAITIGPQQSSTITTPAIIVSTIVGAAPLNDLEIYNQSDGPINLSTWSFTIRCGSQTPVVVSFPNDWILSKNYLTLQSQGVGTNVLIPASNCTAALPLTQIQLLDSGAVEQTVTIPSPPPTQLATGMKQKQRDNAASSDRTITGFFGTDYVALSASDTTLFSDPLYTPPTSTAGLEIVELLPNAPNCSPLDTDFTCGDFVKLFNSSSQPIDLSLFRLRTNYSGNKSSSSNTISLGSTLSPGAFVLVNTKNDGSPLSLTDSGGFVWLEDATGAQIYNPITQYPDASSTSKVGWAWALNGDTWEWTSEPTLEANVFPPAEVSVSATTTTTLTPCAADQERNPATGRCRVIVSASTLVPCATDQERNPATGRCRSLLTSASSTLKPCQPGWTRNPATNRCRKTAVLGDTTKVQDVSVAHAVHNWRWYVAGAVVLAACGYAAYEWRQEFAVAAIRTYGKLAIFRDKFKR